MIKDLFKNGTTASSYIEALKQESSAFWRCFLKR